MTLATNGTLAGTPAFGTAGSYPITITATDANSNTSTQAFTLTVTTSGPVFTSAASTIVRRDTRRDLRGHGERGRPDQLHQDGGTLPTGVTLATSGTLAGTPASGSAGSYPITITATDANAKTATQAFTLTVTASGPVFTSAASTTLRRDTRRDLRGDGER